MDFYVQLAAFLAGGFSGVAVAIAAYEYKKVYVKNGVAKYRNRTINGDMVGGNYTVGNITIGPRSFQGRDLSIINDRIYVDGVDVTDSPDGKITGIVEIKVTGDVNVVRCDRSLTITGNVQGDATSGGSLRCGNITGNATSDGSLQGGDIGGNATSDGSMNCGKVGGSVKAGGSVRHG